MQISPINKPYGQELSTVGADPILLSTIEKGRVAASEISISDTAKVINLCILIDPDKFLDRLAPVTFVSTLQHTEANFNAIIELYTMLIDISLLKLVYDNRDAKTPEEIEKRKTEAKGIRNIIIEFLTVIDSAEARFKNSAYTKIKSSVETQAKLLSAVILHGKPSDDLPSSAASAGSESRPSVLFLVVVVALAIFFSIRKGAK